MKQTFGLLILLVTLFSCSTKPTKTAKSMDSTDNWVTYCDTVPVGFVMTFKYPSDLELADIIDNCRCVGTKIKNDDTNQGTDSTNTRQWSICMQDTADYSVEYLINTWKLMFKGKIDEQRDSIIIDNVKALRVILKDNNKDTPYRQLVYLKKYLTLFELINIYEDTNKDFEKFYNSLTINETTKPSP
ncbi:MAG TPA: hypothetical protein VFG54_21910 [Prolixibacteraceae bacterium]|nr:hypothetical protein [Prolixibacteraceae bacterium]